ncbi:MAG: hypothetical protein C4521_05725 [Actinobacteria bacterium]|nr:MAG: hypothetical protein C4521_05725 [Actinomycetota bacterium]
MVFVMVAVAAYSALWLSERIATARTLSGTSTAAESQGLVSGGWEAAKDACPGGDPRRVLYLAASGDASPGGKSVHTLPNLASTRCGKESDLSCVVASAAAP